jgi:predicted nucleotidyltransferase
MITPSALYNLFPSNAVLDVLSILFMNAEKEYFQSEIVKKLPFTKLQIQRALKRIEDAELINVRRDSSRVFYKANQRNPVFKDLQGMVIKSVGLADRLRNKVFRLSEEIELGFIFGSIADDSARTLSDVDLFCVGNVTSRKLSGILGPVSREIDREINTVLFSRLEFVDKVNEGSNFVLQVLAGAKIWLIGSEDDLEKVLS